MLGVVEPYSCGIGGGGFMVFRDGKTGKIGTLDSREKSPGGDGAEQLLHRRQGADRRPVQRQPLQRPLGRRARHAVRVGLHPAQVRDHQARDALAYGANVALEGFTVDKTFFDQTTPNVPYFDDIPSSAAIYLDPDGTPKDIGTDLRNPDLAKTYERMGRLGVTKGFYTGAVANAIVKAATRPADRPDRRPHVAARPAHQPRPRALPDEGARGGQARLLRPRDLRHGPALLGRARTIGETLNILQDFSRRGVAFASRTDLLLQVPRGEPAGLRRPRPLPRRPVVRQQPDRRACSPTTTPPRARR